MQWPGWEGTPLSASSSTGRRFGRLQCLVTARRMLAGACELCDALERRAKGPALIHVHAVLASGHVGAMRAPLAKHCYVICL